MHYFCIIHSLFLHTGYFGEESGTGSFGVALVTLYMLVVSPKASAVGVSDTGDLPLQWLNLQTAPAFLQKGLERLVPRLCSNLHQCHP